MAVYAPAWLPSTQVVVLGVRASWSAQAAGAEDPGVHRIVRLLRERLGLKPEQCVADSLIACGAGDNITADEVAACSRRFADRAEQGAAPLLVIFETMRAQALAEVAGLVDGLAWRTGGCNRTAHAVVADSNDEDLIAKVASFFGIRYAPKLAPDQTPLLKHGVSLLTLLGKHWSHREVPRDVTAGASKKQKYRGPLHGPDVARHLMGLAEITPTRTYGPWLFVVVRITQSTAVHVAHFDEILAAVLAALPASYRMQNKETGEVRVYVNVPEDMSYNQGALLVRAYLSQHRWRVSGSTPRTVLAELVAVPSEPVSLPFGRGWEEVGGAASLEQQLEKLISFLRTRNTSDFQRAEYKVESSFNVRHRWTNSKRARLRTDLTMKELRTSARALPADWPERLGGGWPAVRSRLTSRAARVAGLGLLHDGARGRWTRMLIRELADVVPRPELDDLMQYWLRGHAHVDELFVADARGVELEVRRMTDRHYKNLRGVPVRFWELIDRRVTASWRKYASKSAPPSGNSTPAHRVTLEAVKATAFFIARDFFYKARVVERFISSSVFERLTGTNTSGDVGVVLLEDKDWLIQTGAEREKKHSRRFCLAQDLWPPRDGERVLYLPP